MARRAYARQGGRRAEGGDIFVSTCLSASLPQVLSVRENSPQDVFPIWNTVLLSGLAPDARPACDFVNFLVMY